MHWIRSATITLSPFWAKMVLRFNPFTQSIVVCKGYNEDYENFTELVWEDDKDLDFYDKESYPEFQLWVN
jgi:hypothetical protein